MIRIQLRGYFQPVRTIRMLGYGTTSTASWLCGGWGWLIGRTQTGMRIRPKPTSSSRYVKVQCNPVTLFFSYGSGFKQCVCIAAVSRIWQGFPILGYVSCSYHVSICASRGVRCSWQPSGKQVLENCGRETTPELKYK